MMNFADYLQHSIEKRSSILCAGFDLRFDQIPEFFHATSGTHDERIAETVQNYYLASLEALEPHIACIKPNIAFFERCGLGALQALRTITAAAKERGIPVILDAKRGDIGSTNAAYAESYFAPPNIFGETVDTIHADALTVNLSLGLESVAPFVQVAADNGRGIFFLVRTSNPDSSLFQNATTESGDTVCHKISKWLDTEGEKFTGSTGYSGLGAVVGATHPEEAKELRALMPKNFFLIPGFGAQGGSADEAVAGMAITNGLPGGAIVNSSRGLFAQANKTNDSKKDFKDALSQSAQEAKELLAAALLKQRV